MVFGTTSEIDAANARVKASNAGGPGLDASKVDVPFLTEATEVMKVPNYILPSLGQIGAALWRGYVQGEFWVHLFFTTQALVIGYVAGAVVGIALGTLLVTALYLALNASFLHAAPMSELAGKLDVGHVAAEHIFGLTGGKITSGLKMVIGILKFGYTVSDCRGVIEAAG